MKNRTTVERKSERELVTMALLYVQQSNLTHQNTWQTKGLSGPTAPSPSCSILLVQTNRASSEWGALGYAVDTALPVYLRASCHGDLQLESLQEGQWVSLMTLDSYDNYLGKNDELLDLRPYLGQRLRLQSAEGLSEEFTLVGTP